MKIAIVSVCVPFVYGGAEFLAESLKDKLKEYGYQTALVKIPFQWFPPQKIIEHILACRLLCFENIDKVIALKFPAYHIKHPNKVLWLLHQHRQAYDLWDMPYGIQNTPEELQIRNAIIKADNFAFSEAAKIYTNSRVVSDRLKKFNNVKSQVLYPPLVDVDKFYCEEYGDYFFFPSRIGMGKRQYLSIEAMRYTQSKVKLVIAGNPDFKDQLDNLKSSVKKNNLEDRVKIIGNWISQEDKADFFAHCLGCIYVPYDEDSYGFVSLEAYHSKKPVITCSDSGGTLEIVEDGVNGFVVLPEPQAIAEAMDSLYQDRALAKKMGQKGYDKLLSMNINWNNVVERLAG